MPLPRYDCDATVDPRALQVTWIAVHDQVAAVTIDSSLEEDGFEPSVPRGMGHRYSTGKRRLCEVAHTFPPSGTITYGATQG